MARKVKYDHDPKNDYSDGYNAGRRFVKPDKQGLLTIFLIILAIALFLWVAFAVARSDNDIIYEPDKPSQAVGEPKEKDKPVEPTQPVTLPETGIGK